MESNRAATGGPAPAKHRNIDDAGDNTSMCLFNTMTYFILIILLQIYHAAQAMVVQSAEDLVAKIHTLLDSNDFNSADAHLGHLIGLANISGLYDHIRSSIDIAYSCTDIREVINTRMTTTEREIEAAESYTLMRQRLDLVKAMSSDLHLHLNDANKALVARLEYLLSDRINRQYTDIISQINALGKEGDHFVAAQEKDKYLTELLAHNLSLMADVDKLHEDCTQYRSATEALNDVLSSHGEKFLSELPKEPTSSELALSFKVLKDVSRSQCLLVHTSAESQSLYGRCERALSQLYVSHPFSFPLPSYPLPSINSVISNKRLLLILL